MKYIAYACSKGTIETNERLSFFLRNSTNPSVNANNPNVVSWVMLGTTLTYDDVSGNSGLTTKDFNA
jgi:hypothetical protein